MTTMFAVNGLDRQRLGRLGLLLLGLLVPQIILFGPSLAGQKLLLPTEILTGPRQYILPARSELDVVHLMAFADFVTHNEPDRMFAAAEFRAGRLPLWNPYIFAGTPFVVWPRFAPHTLLYCLFPTPVILAWLQLGKAIVAGVGAYLFFRRVLQVSVWPALLGAWCFPLTSYFVVWQGAIFTYALATFPWLLLVIETIIAAPRRWGGPALAALTGLILISVSLDFAALILLAAGSYALCRLICRSSWVDRAKGALVLATAWGLGFAIALPAIVPLMQHARASYEFTRRQAGFEPMPPLGPAIALPQLVLPQSEGPFGTPGKGYFQLFSGAFVISNAAAYAGLLATLWLAPLAWLSRAHLSFNLIWLSWICLGLAWPCDVPGLVWLMRLPGLNVLPYYRFVFLTSFGILALAVVGVEMLTRAPTLPRYYWILVTPLVALGGWCLWQCVHWPEPFASQIESTLQRGFEFSGVPNVAALRECQLDFAQSRLVGAGLCGLGLACWLAVFFRLTLTKWVTYALTSLWLLELVFLGPHRTPQGDPALYYPDLTVFETLRRSEPGRIVGVMCFPPDYGVTQRLHDIRGYDGMSPARLVEVLELAAAAPLNAYTPTQLYLPRLLKTESGGLRPSPIFSMLHVRWFLACEPIPGLPHQSQSDGFFVYENPDAVARVFIPAEVEAVQSDRLPLLARPDFDPRDTAYVESPAFTHAGAGKVQIVDEVPTQITIQAEMETPGLVILADRWDADWHAYVNDAEVSLVRADYVLRGVLAPAGRSKIVFRYQPHSFYVSLIAAGVALAVLVLWLGLVGRRGDLSNPPTGVQ
jgi:hypothetical protein